MKRTRSGGLKTLQTSFRLPRVRTLPWNPAGFGTSNPSRQPQPATTPPRTHVLDFLVSAVIRDLLAQVDQHVVAGVVGLSQQQVDLLPPLLIAQLLVLQHRQDLVGGSAEDIARLPTEQRVAPRRTLPREGDAVAPSRFWTLAEAPKGHPHSEGATATSPSPKASVEGAKPSAVVRPPLARGSPRTGRHRVLAGAAGRLAGGC